MLTLTFPMVGNYGVPEPSRMDEFGLRRGFESSRIHAAALVVQDYSHEYSHWNAHMSLGDWLKSEVSGGNLSSASAYFASVFHTCSRMLLTAVTRVAVLLCSTRALGRSSQP